MTATTVDGTQPHVVEGNAYEVLRVRANTSIGVLAEVVESVTHEFAFTRTLDVEEVIGSDALRVLIDYASPGRRPVAPSGAR